MPYDQENEMESPAVGADASNAIHQRLEVGKEFEIGPELPLPGEYSEGMPIIADVKLKLVGQSKDGGYICQIENIELETSEEGEEAEPPHAAMEAGSSQRRSSMVQDLKNQASFKT